jgi:hypothetical protein
MTTEKSFQLPKNTEGHLFINLFFLIDMIREKDNFDSHDSRYINALNALFDAQDKFVLDARKTKSSQTVPSKYKTKLPFVTRTELEAKAAKLYIEKLHNK